jgi:hypothetical protein
MAGLLEAYLASLDERQSSQRLTDGESQIRASDDGDGPFLPFAVPIPSQF